MILKLAIGIAAACLIYLSALALAERFTIVGMVLLVLGIAFAIPAIS